MTLTVVPSTTHSSSVSGQILSFFRTWEGTETWPRFVTFVRTIQFYKMKTYDKSSLFCHHVLASQPVLWNQQHLAGGFSCFELPVGFGCLGKREGLVDPEL